MERASTLQVVKDEEVIDRIPLAPVLDYKEGGITFGRELYNEVRTDHASCSRLHAAVNWKDDCLFVKDLHSRHGTFLKCPGGAKEQVVPQEPRKIKEGATLTLGASTRSYTFVKLETLSAELKTLGANKKAECLLDLPNNQVHLEEQDQVDTELAKLAADKVVTELPALLDQKLRLTEQGSVAGDAIPAIHGRKQLPDRDGSAKGKEAEPGTANEDVLTVSSTMANLSLEREKAEVRRTVSEPAPQNSPSSGQGGSRDKEEAAEEVLQTEVTSGKAPEAPSVEKKPQGEMTSATPVETAAEGCPPKRCMRPGAARKHKEVTQRMWQLIVDTNILLDPMDFTYMQKMLDAVQLVGLGKKKLVLVIVPRVVLKELDCFNHRSRSDQSNCRRHIRAVFRFLEAEHLVQGGSLVHLQEPNEQPDPRQLRLLCGSRDRHIYACMDDYILEAVHFFRMKGTEKRSTMETVLVTNDRALRLRARSEGLTAQAGQDCFTKLIHECSRVSHSHQRHSPRRKSARK